MSSLDEIISTSLDARELSALARLDMDKGHFDQALIKIKTALQVDDKCVDALAIGGRVYAQIGLYDKAQILLQKFLEQRPDSTIEAFQYGMVQFDMGLKADALSTWTKLLAREPNFPPALYFSSVVLLEEGRIVEARQSINKILNTAPADNLYFGKARDLLTTIESGAQPFGGVQTTPYEAIEKKKLTKTRAW